MPGSKTTSIISETIYTVNRYAVNVRRQQTNHRKGTLFPAGSGSARKAAPVAEVECQVVRCVGESSSRGRSISESDPTVQTARKHNTTKLERRCPGGREVRNREDQGYPDDRRGSRSGRAQAPGEQKSGRK